MKSNSGGSKMAEKIKPNSAAEKAEFPEAVVPAGENSPGLIRINSAALAALVRRAACQVDGVTRITGSSLVDNIAEFVGSRKVLDRAIQIKISKSAVEIELAINIRYGVSLPKIAGNVQNAVARQIEDTTGLTVSAVNVTIREMENPAEDENEES